MTQSEGDNNSCQAEALCFVYSPPQPGILKGLKVKMTYLKVFYKYVKVTLSDESGSEYTFG